MQLEQRQKELAAIGASVGANCRPCIEHHVAAGREAGLSEQELEDAIAVAEAVRDEAIRLFSAKLHELFRRGRPSTAPGGARDASADRALVALGASVGANSHPLLHTDIAKAFDSGLSRAQVAAALKMAGYVQQRAAGITADKATSVLEELGPATEHSPAHVGR